MTTTPTAIGKPESSKLGDIYRFIWPASGVQIEFDRVGEGREGIYAEIVVAQLHEGKPTLLHASRLNLMSPTARGSAVKALAARYRFDWSTAVDQACFLAVQKFREGEPTIDLREVNHLERPRWLLKPYLEHGGPTVLFAPGGTSKTMLAVAMSVTIASGRNLMGWLQGPAMPVLFLDWETDRFTHAERMNAICEGANLHERPPVFYRRMSTPLTESVGVIRREVDRLKAGALFIDSLGQACGGELESAETILKCFGAIRSIGLPTMVVSHVTKNVAREGATGTYHRLSPFGSIYTENQARNTWSVQRAGEEDADEIAIALIHEKTNNGRYQKRHAYTLQFTNEGDDQGDEHMVTLDITACNLSDIAAFDVRRPLKDRILAQFERGMLRTSHEIAEDLGLPVKDIAPRLSELKRNGLLVRLNDRYGRKSPMEDAS